MIPRLLHVNAVGVAGSFGVGCEALLEAIDRGSPPVCPVRLETPGGMTVAVLQADLEPLAGFVDKRDLRRIDRYARLALLGAHLALKDAGLAAPLGDRTALVVATGWGAVNSTFGFLDTMIDGRDALSSPTLFSNSVHNSAAAQISMNLQVTGPNLTATQLAMPVANALLGATDLLAEADVDRVLFGAVDEVSPVYANGMERLGRQSLFGEGASFFVLSARPEDARYGSVEIDWNPDRAGPGGKVFAPDGVACTKRVLGHMPTISGMDLAAAAFGVAKGLWDSAVVIEGDGEGRCAALRLKKAG